MAAHWGSPGSPPSIHAGEGFLTRLLQMIGLQSPPPGQLPGQAQPADQGAIAAGKFSIEELDAAIADSMQRGAVDLSAAEELARLRASRDAGPAAEAMAAMQEAAQEEIKAFGGDLYPTTAHGFGGHIRYVRKGSWSGGARK